MQSILIPETMFAHSDKSEIEIRLALAIFMYRDLKISAGKASEFIGLSRIEFWEELGKRNIPMNYDIDEFNQDLENITRFQKLKQNRI